MMRVSKCQRQAKTVVVEGGDGRVLLVAEEEDGKDAGVWRCRRMRAIRVDLSCK